MKRSIKNDIKYSKDEIFILKKQLRNCIKYINCLVFEVSKLKNEHKFEKEYERFYTYDLSEPKDIINPDLNEIKDSPREAYYEGYKFLKSFNLLSEFSKTDRFQERAGLYEKVNTNERI